MIRYYRKTDRFAKFANNSNFKVIHIHLKYILGLATFNITPQVEWYFIMFEDMLSNSVAPTSFIQIFLQLLLCYQEISMICVRACVLCSRCTWGEPLYCWWLIWQIQNDVKNMKNDINHRKWVLIWEYSARAIQWIPTWQGLGSFQKFLCPCTLDESSLSIGRVKEKRTLCSGELVCAVSGDQTASCIDGTVMPAWSFDQYWYRS